jgi:hypothetical protein
MNLKTCWIKGGRVKSLDAAGISKAAAGFEPLARCDLKTVVLSSVTVKYRIWGLQDGQNLYSGFLGYVNI